MSKIRLQNGAKNHNKAGLIAEMHRDISTLDTRMSHAVRGIDTHNQINTNIFFHISSPCLYKVKLRDWNMADRKYMYTWYLPLAVNLQFIRIQVQW